MADQQTTDVAEVDVPWLDEAETRAWISLMAIVLKLPGLLDGQLQRSCDVGLFEYSVMSWLSMSDRGMLRMSTLAELANGSLSRLSNVVKRLEGQGWVQREPDPFDGRYTVAVLTDSGLEQVVAAAPGHVRAVRHFVFDPLSVAQVRQLGAIGQRIDGRLTQQPPPDQACDDTGTAT